MRTLRLIVSGIYAGIAASLPPVLMSLYVLATDTGLDNLGQPDDAPRRAAGVFLVLSPILVLVSGVVVLACVGLLHLTHSYSLKSLLGCALALGVIVGAYFAADGYATFGARDALISLGVFSAYGFLCFALGAFAWWHSSRWRDA